MQSCLYLIWGKRESNVYVYLYIYDLMSSYCRYTISFGYCPPPTLAIFMDDTTKMGAFHEQRDRILRIISKCDRLNFIMLNFMWERQYITGGSLWIILRAIKRMVVLVGANFFSKISDEFCIYIASYSVIFLRKILFSLDKYGTNIIY